MDTKIPSDDPIKYLVYAKFPELVILAQQKNGMYDALAQISEIDDMPTLETHEWPSLPEEAETYRSELALKDKAEIDALYKETVHNTHLIDDQKRFFNQIDAQADFDYWSKMSEWELNEAVTLAFGKNPEIVTEEKIENISADISPFVHDWKKLKLLAERAKKSNHFTDSKFPMSYDPIKPHKFVSWMQANDLGFPKELAENVFNIYTANLPPKTETEKFIDSMSKRLGTAPLNVRSEQVKTAPQLKEETKVSPQADTMSERERSSNLAIIGALLGLLLGKTSSGIPYSQFESQQAIIDCIHATYGDKSGLSTRNLEDKFAKAKEKTRVSSS